MRAALLILALVGCRSGAVTSGPPRVVSLTPSATEIVAALGATSLLVGVDEFSKYPPEVQTLPKVGSFLSPNIEAIARLRPTLVIVDDVHSRAAGALHDNGIATVECAIHSLPDVKAALVRVGDKLGRSAEAKRAVGEIDAALDAAAQKRGPRVRVMAIIDREAGGLGGLVAAGTGSWVDELLAVLGAENVLIGAGVRYPKLSIEEVKRAKPEVILDLSFGGDPKVWDGVVPGAKVVATQEAYLISPSPRVVAALDALARAIR